MPTKVISTQMSATEVIQCPVCLEEKGSWRGSTTATCGHQTCMPCFVTHITTNGLDKAVCPMCRGRYIESAGGEETDAPAVEAEICVNCNGCDNCCREDCAGCEWCCYEACRGCQWCCLEECEGCRWCCEEGCDGCKWCCEYGCHGCHWCCNNECNGCMWCCTYECNGCQWCCVNTCRGCEWCCNHECSGCKWCN